NILAGELLDVAGQSTADGANVQTWSANGQDNQDWSLRDQGHGHYALVAHHSGKCLDVAGAATVDGAHVDQLACDGQGTQQGTLAPSSITGEGSPTAVLRQHMIDRFTMWSGHETLVGVENKDSGTPTSDTQRVDAIAGRPSSFWGGDFGFGGAVDQRWT